ncbi:Na(+)/H(+) antiporter subunit D [Rhodobacteraceae bacterium NNCM2]|nr:Na(+)/H(+) antiporter subunit D [Coraliihabitans acroporae]
MTTDLIFHPGLVLIIAGLVLPFLPVAMRAVVLLAAPLLTLAAVWTVGDGPQITATYLGMELIPLQGDALSRVFATIFSIMGFAGALFAMRQERVIELAAAFVYAGGAISVAFAGDLITVFIFWEIMAIASTIVVAMGPNARGASLRYAVIHFLGGVILMIGIAGHVLQTGSTAFTAMEANDWATWCILAAFLINAGAPPLAAWLPDAYPASSWSGMVFLSAFTTKTSVYTLIRGFPGEEVLIGIGLFMVFYGIIMALLENDMRRILAYSIINQVGFMVTAVGIGTPLALDGATAHAFAHIIYKALLLMSAGAVLYATGRSKCTEVGGLFRYMPVSCICGIIGALSISALPLTSGFVSKSLISSAAGEAHLFWVWMALTAASAGVFFHAGIKFPWFVFFNRKDYLYLHEGTPKDPPWNMQAAMILFSAACIGLGIWYSPLYELLPNKAMVTHHGVTEVYTAMKAAKIVEQLQLLFFSGLAFFLLLDWMKRTTTITLDVDWLWRGLPQVVAGWFGIEWALAWDTFLDRVEGTLQRLWDDLNRTHGAEGTLARTRPSGATALWMTVLLSAFLLFSFV